MRMNKKVAVVGSTAALVIAFSGPVDAARLTGNSGVNRIIGTQQADRIEGQAGNDTLSGSGGDDSINGGKGNDLISGGFGDDILRGSDDDDHLIGGPGNDTLSGDGGNDLVEGGDGEDTLINRSGRDILRGGGGIDRYVLTNGTHIIEDQRGRSTIDIRAVGRSAARFSRSGKDLVVRYGSSSVIVKNHFTRNTIGAIRFLDSGEKVTRNQIAAAVRDDDRRQQNSQGGRGGNQRDSRDGRSVNAGFVTVTRGGFTVREPIDPKDPRGVENATRRANSKIDRERAQQDRSDSRGSQTKEQRQAGDGLPESF